MSWLKNSIIKKILLICFAFIIIPVILATYFSLETYKNGINDLSKEYIWKTIEKTNNYIDDIMDKMGRLTFSIYKSDNTFGFANQNAFDYLSEKIVMGVDDSKKEIAIQSFLNTLINYEPDAIYNAFIVDKDGTYYYAANNSMMSSIKHDYNFLEQDWFNRIKNHESRRVLVRTDTEVPKDYLFRNPDENLILIARNIYDIDKDLETSYIATLCLNINMSFLDNYLEIRHSDSQRVSIVDNHGIVIYSTDKTIFGTSLSAYSRIKELNNSNVFETNIEGRKYVVSYVHSDSTGWYVISETDYKQLTSRDKDVERSAVIIIILFAIIAIVIFKILYDTTAIPVNAILMNMKRIEDGKFSDFIELKDNDEFSHINVGLISMAQNLEVYIEKAYIAEIKKQEANIYALQSQINPHFFMNILEKIRDRLLNKKDKETAKIILLIGKMLRQSLSNLNSLVTVKEEIEFVNNYIKVISYGTPNRYNFEIDVPYEFMEYKIPKMIIQPIVENAFKHGLEKKQGEGLIKIYCYATVNNLNIVVTDNGCGMSVETLQQITQLLESNQLHLDSYHIGLKNVHDRIRNYFGKKYGIKISSIENQGTAISLVLPLQH